MTKFKIFTIATAMLAFVACSKDYDSDLKKRLEAARENSEKIQPQPVKDKADEEPAKIEKAEIEEIPIPITDSSDKGKYFLISKQQIKNGFIIIYKRVGLAQTTFSKYEVQCKTKKMRTLGEGVDSADNVHDYEEKGEWFKPLADASTGDAFKFVCK